MGLNETKKNSQENQKEDPFLLYTYNDTFVQLPWSIFKNNCENEEAAYEKIMQKATKSRNILEIRDTVDAANSALTKCYIDKIFPKIYDFEKTLSN